ncbi:MAG: aldolase catalytic domain-containing protein [Opitutales bacterium]
MNAKAKTSSNATQSKWVGYRENLKVLDCTIRDGGLMNNSRFTDEEVKEVYSTLTKANVDYMEIGYKNSEKIFSTKDYGPWRFSKDEDISRIIDDLKTENSPKIAVMADAEKSDMNDVLPCDKSPIDLIRVATYIHQIPLALEMLKDAQDKGYETALNLMAISTVRERELDEALELLCAAKPNTVYLVDSFGSLYGEQISYLLRKYHRYTKAEGIELGIHAHNNMQLAFSNTIEAILRGATMLDATIAGLGRGAGNCQLELLLGFLHNPKYKIRPVLECVQDTIEPMREALGWGFDYPYMISGIMNSHPKSAIAQCEGENRKKIVEFYDSMTAQ